MEGGVEDRHLRHVRPQLAGDLDPERVGRVVQGRERDHLANRVEDPLVHDGRGAEGLAPVDDPVPDPR